MTMLVLLLYPQSRFFFICITAICSKTLNTVWMIVMIEVKHLPPFSVWKRWAGTIFVISLLVFSALVFVFSMLCCTLDESASAGGMNDIKMISGMTYLVCFVSAILKYSTRENLIVFVSFLMMLLVSAIRALARERWYLSKRELKRVPQLFHGSNFYVMCLILHIT